MLELGEDEPPLLKIGSSVSGLACLAVGGDSDPQTLSVLARGVGDGDGVAASSAIDGDGVEAEVGMHDAIDLEVLDCLAELQQELEDHPLFQLHPRLEQGAEHVVVKCENLEEGRLAVEPALHKRLRGLHVSEAQVRIRRLEERSVAAGDSLLRREAGEHVVLVEVAITFR